MSQQTRVLQCIECKLFQVDIVKKSNKWQCKVCNVKQNVNKEFIRGSGQECRVTAQELNYNYGKQQERNKEKAFELRMNECENFTESKERLSINSSKKVNKWNVFVDTSSENLTHENLEDSNTFAMLNSNGSGGSSLGDDSFNQRQKVSKRQHSGEATMTTLAKKPSSNNKWNNFI